MAFSFIYLFIYLFFDFLNIHLVQPVQYSEVNRQRHTGIEIWIKNCPLNNSDCYMEVFIADL